MFIEGYWPSFWQLASLLSLLITLRRLSGLPHVLYYLMFDCDKTD